MAYTNVAGRVRISAKYVSSERLASSRYFIDWDQIDTVILDMDGTLLDLHFDQAVWGQLLPQRFAAALGCTIEQATLEVARRLAAARGTLAWYCLGPLVRTTRHRRRQIGARTQPLGATTPRRYFVPTGVGTRRLPSRISDQRAP